MRNIQATSWPDSMDLQSVPIPIGKLQLFLEQQFNFFK